MEKLYDIRMKDGSRHFADLPETADWNALREHLAALEGAQITSFVTDHVTEAWIDFHYQGHQFAANNQHGNWWFFVKDPECPDDILTAVVEHFRGLLGGG